MLFFLSFSLSFFPNAYKWTIYILIFPMAFLFVGFILFWMNIMGGGDSKYLSSLYLLIPIKFQEVTLVYLLYATILVGSTLLLFNILKNFDTIWLHLKMGDIVGIKKIFGKNLLMLQLFLSHGCGLDGKISDIFHFKK